MHRPYLISLALILTLLGAACSPAPQPTPTPTDLPQSLAAPATSTTAPTPTAVPESPATPATAEAEPASPAPTETPAPASSPAPGARQVRFVIVPEETVASYSIDETFINQDNKLVTAVGKTGVVEGELTLNFDDPAASEFGRFTVDISTLTSDKARRDNAIRRQWLESAQYPLATFVVREVRDFPPDARQGQPVQFLMVGDMTVKETTRQVTWDVTATLEGDRLSGTATTFILLADFNVPAPSIAGVLSVTDGATLTLEFTMQGVN